MPQVGKELRNKEEMHSIPLKQILIFSFKEVLFSLEWKGHQINILKQLKNGHEQERFGFSLSALKREKWPQGVEAVARGYCGLDNKNKQEE